MNYETRIFPMLWPPNQGDRLDWQPLINVRDYWHQDNFRIYTGSVNYTGDIQKKILQIGYIIQNVDVKSQIDEIEYLIGNISIIGAMGRKKK